MHMLGKKSISYFAFLFLFFFRFQLCGYRVTPIFQYNKCQSKTDRMREKPDILII